LDALRRTGGAIARLCGSEHGQRCRGRDDRADDQLDGDALGGQQDVGYLPGHGRRRQPDQQYASQAAGFRIGALTCGDVSRADAPGLQP